ncbi:hypothetical protein MPTK1_7g03220 [Marchantia polymorpha subsp. ruderalis]|uniref:Uncharacterized protein n=2 Tax=Marchantia polymorpha TaxID=3197 RepID=A0AAF6BVN1_MARPO|nr:hypothetical protein MARPO_0074s0074 [Marchantia polymorpha]BBN16065.1 hypothetical protein Mp_7g03220 [Marchantia polymorpha subsp. ruderalis]|eukprot:PTQ35100.1 hypothetical protein MARPO_0074s0074 [Marchantia polymorpha]
MTVRPLTDEDMAHHLPRNEVLAWRSSRYYAHLSMRYALLCYPGTELQKCKLRASYPRSTLCCHDFALHSFQILEVQGNRATSSAIRSRPFMCSTRNTECTKSIAIHVIDTSPCGNLESKQK